MKIIVVVAFTLLCVFCLAVTADAARSGNVVFLREMFKLNGVQWETAQAERVGGITVYKDGTGSPNTLTIYSNYAFGQPSDGTDAVGTILLITKSKNGKPVAVRLVSDGDTNYVQIDGGELRVNGDLRVTGNLYLQGEKQ